MTNEPCWSVLGGPYQHPQRAELHRLVPDWTSERGTLLTDPATAWYGFLGSGGEMEMYCAHLQDHLGPTVIHLGCDTEGLAESPVLGLVKTAESDSLADAASTARLHLGAEATVRLAGGGPQCRAYVGISPAFDASGDDDLTNLAAERGVPQDGNVQVFAHRLDPLDFMLQVPSEFDGSILVHCWTEGELEVEYARALAVEIDRVLDVGHVVAGMHPQVMEMLCGHSRPVDSEYHLVRTVTSTESTGLIAATLKKQ